MLLWRPAIQSNTHLVGRLMGKGMCRRAIQGTRYRLVRIAGFQRRVAVVAGNSSLSARYLGV